MSYREIDSGFELVLDNRKLILAFVVVITVCGCFFVWGFMAGKRQGMQLAAISESDISTAAGLETPLTPALKEDEELDETPAVEEENVQEELGWYQSVNRKEGEPVAVQPPRSSGTEKKTAGSAAAVSKVESGPVTYSVQVGAFKQSKRAEAHAMNIRSKGFDSRVQTPESSDKLYLVKVGKFDTRAEAVAEQRRLKKDGFNGYVKTN
jgi:septal ring-binding cell division protein DamX